MLFDERPKSNTDDLFGREKEMKKFQQAIRLKRPLVVISGPRRVGKTSLLKTMINQNIRYSIFIDLRTLGSQRTASRNDMTRLIQTSLQEFLDNNRAIAQQIIDVLRTVRGVSFAGVNIRLESKPERQLDMMGLFAGIDRWAGQNGDLVLLAIDEAQQFRKATHLNTAGLLASIYDNCRNITTVLTGSEVGLLYDFMGADDPQAHLYGRSYAEIKVKRLSKEQSIEFLAMGLEQYHIKREEPALGMNPVYIAAEQLGGIMGWLNKFGLECVESGKITLENIKKTQKMGSHLAKQEYDNFISTRTARERYNVVMNAMAAEPSSWSMIKTRLEMNTKKKIYPKNLSNLLSTLQKAGFVACQDGRYSVEDPLLKMALQK